MDPLSITTGALALLGVCIKTGVKLKEFYDGAATANIRASGLLADVESFTQLLRFMKDTLEEENIQSSLQSTGHIGNHWNNLSTSIRDGQSTLLQLQETIEKANKSVALLDGPRRHLRLKGAAEEIAVFQRQIRSYKDTLQLSLQSIALWSQVTIQESMDKILPNLDEIHREIRRIAFDINDRISSLQTVIESKSSDHELRSLNNLRNCVKSAASVVSSASTNPGAESSIRLSIYDSEFGDCFSPEPGETMLRWISSNAVQESKEGEDNPSSISEPKLVSGKSFDLAEKSPESDKSDSDGELEAEIMQSLLRRGKDKLASREFKDAERHFRNCLTRASSTRSSMSLHRPIGPTLEIMTLLLTTYRSQEKWDEAHSLLIEKIALESRGSSKDNQGVLADTLILVEVLFNKSAYAEALLHGRRALKSYRKLGSDGTSGVRDSLRLLRQVCKAAGYHDEEDAYSAHLSYVLQQPVQNAANALAPNESESAASPTMPTIEEELLSKEAGAQNLASLDISDSNSGWLSVDQFSPSSSTRTHQRGSSLSSLGSAGPASPNTTRTSFSGSYREGSSAIKEFSLPDPDSPFEPDSTPLPDPVGSSVPELFSSLRLEGTFEQMKVENGLQSLPATKSTNTVIVTPENSQGSHSNHPRDAADTESDFTAPPPLNSPLKRQRSKVPQIIVHHSQRSFEEAATKYLREKKGDPPKAVIPEEPAPQVSINPVSDYELPQWVVTLRQDSDPVETPKVSLQPPDKSVQKSKSATELYNVGAVESPVDLIKKSKSTMSLNDYSTTAIGIEKADPPKTTSAVNQADNSDVIHRPANQSSSPETGQSKTSETSSVIKGKHDWDVIFAPLDKFDTVGHSTRHVIPSTDHPARGINSGSTPLQVELSTSLLDVETQNDHILEKVDEYDNPASKALVEIGHPDDEALSAVKKCDFDLERPEDYYYLLTESIENSNLTGSQNQRIRSKSASSTKKEKHMGVLDFSFFVTPVPETGEDSSVSRTNLETRSPFGPPSRPISFHDFDQIQGMRSAASSFLDRPSPTGLTTRRSEPNMTEQAKSQNRGSSPQVENLRPRNPLAAHFDVDLHLPVESPGDGPLIANDLSTDLTTVSPSKSAEARPSSRPNLDQWLGAITGNLSTVPIVTLPDPRDKNRRQLVIVGDAFCGKTLLCSVFCENVYRKTYRSTYIETFFGHVHVDGISKVDLWVRDTGGDHDIPGIRLQCYKDSHVVLLCFAIDSPDSLANVEKFFIKELQKAKDCSARYMLVGLKEDLRSDNETMKRLQIVNQQPVTVDEARAVALRIGAAKYVECSALTREGVGDVFDAAGRLALLPTEKIEKIKKMRSFRSLFGKD